MLKEYNFYKNYIRVQDIQTFFEHLLFRTSEIGILNKKRYKYIVRPLSMLIGDPLGFLFEILYKIEDKKKHFKQKIYEKYIIPNRVQIGRFYSIDGKHYIYDIYEPLYKTLFKKLLNER